MCQCPVDAQACSVAPQLAVGFFTSFLGLLWQVLIETQHKVCLLWQDHHPLASSMNCADALALHVPDAASAWAGLDRASNLARFTLSEPPSWPGLRLTNLLGAALLQGVPLVQVILVRGLDRKCACFGSVRHHGA